MINERELVTDKEDFYRLRGECEKVIEINARLPNFVFSRSFIRFCAFEHAYIMTPQFPAFLHSIATRFEDTAVYYMTIRPDPVDYYYNSLSFFGMATFKTEELLERYMPVMSRHGEADSFFKRGGDISAFWGQSLQWAIFCDRISWELAVFGTAREMDMSRVTTVRCLNAETLSRYIRSQYRSDVATASDFVKMFVHSYSFNGHAG